MIKSTTKHLSASLHTDEQQLVQQMIADLAMTGDEANGAADLALKWVQAVRKNKSAIGTVESFLQHYSLTSSEGRALMSMAEALIRIPDSKKADELIEDKMTVSDWASSSQTSDLSMKAAGLGLMITGQTLNSPLAKLSKPIIRKSMLQAMRQMGQQFVLGEDIHDAFVHAAAFEKKGYRLSYDMLGEAARTFEDAEQYFLTYRNAIRAIGHRIHAGSPSENDPKTVPGISVKLSALYPRYEMKNHAECVDKLSDKLLQLCQEAARYNISLTVDAEESERLVPSLDIIESVFTHSSLSDWQGFGFAVQAYQKRALPVLEWAVELSKSSGKPIQVRLVKGAYWDSEIKRAQILGLNDYPVFTRKCHSDISFLRCGDFMLQHSDRIVSMFATHNAHTISSLQQIAKRYDASFELQRLHGMGEALYKAIQSDEFVRCSIYAPVGPHKDLLPYLVRRLLENGANSSFVNQLLDDDVAPESLIEDPIQKSLSKNSLPHDKILLPQHLYREEKPQGRSNSYGFDLQDFSLFQTLQDEITPYLTKSSEAFSKINGKKLKETDPQNILSPTNTDDVVGKVWPARQRYIERAFGAAQEGFVQWQNFSQDHRINVVKRYADLLEDHTGSLIALLMREAGKTYEDAHLELREAVDFCRYYANQSSHSVGQYHDLPGPTGETNRYTRQGRGVFVAISPWNFPLAIFTGQIASALVTGNSVIAKPAEQTPLIATFAAELWFQAGLPEKTLSLLIGDGDIGAKLVAHPSVAGVVFTGSNAAANSIQQTLSLSRRGIVPFIAETGGQNAMVVDSSALPEQVVDDVIKSAFGSAGQRCSALRILLVQDDIADPLLRVLRGAMRTLKIQSPLQYNTDIGPIIDEYAFADLKNYRTKIRDFGTTIYEVDDSKQANGHYFGPCAYEIDDMSYLEKEIFGPVLHVIRYSHKDLFQRLDDLNDLGYGLTFGIHSRVDSFVQKVSDYVRAGNVYVNRGMTGAVVGTQPFGGLGLSGTGPKAGGPDYLKCFTIEKVISEDITVSGGNASLVSLEE